MVSLQKCTCYLKSLVLKSTPMSPTAFHPSHISRLTGSDQSPLYQQTRPPVRTDVPRTLPPLITPSLRTPFIPGRWMQNLSLWPIRIYYLSILIRATIWVCEILTLFSDFSISIFESIPEIYKHKKLCQRRHSRFCSKGGKHIVRRAHNAVR